ncbi:MAG: DGQHR domain-containing protein [Candidatus Electronema aureum]|uniref:DGQHR domain-containing protein n=1 Tax=Candidatus Electronema aureum TaxID=2005002 RepID=A0A521G3W7_9BACT|nr:MAG: DGQHR domain-containing protein [Candidatus Electronema aureum]
MENKISRPAAVVKQGNLTLYTTSLKVSDLLKPNFYSVETLDPDDNSDQGYQRLLNKARAKKLADYIIEGMKTQDVFLPTSIFIATDKDIDFNIKTNTISFDINFIGPFSVVDGQHRIEGLKMASQKEIKVLDFEIPVNIATGLSRISQMCHFLIVNTTQKSVDKAIEQRIYARLTKALQVEHIPSLPKWIERAVKKGEDDIALKFIDYLNSEDDSPWRDRIEMANKESKSASVNQKSFARTIKQFVLVANNPLTIYPIEKSLKIFLNYWKAISNILYVNEPTVLFKYNGIQLFCRFSVPFFSKLHEMNDFKVPTMESLLRDTFENLDGDYAGLGHSEWWNSGGKGKASYLNSGALHKIAALMASSMHKSSLNKNIEL